VRQLRSFRCKCRAQQRWLPVCDSNGASCGALARSTAARASLLLCCLHGAAAGQGHLMASMMIVSLILSNVCVVFRFKTSLVIPAQQRHHRQLTASCAFRPSEKFAATCATSKGRCASYTGCANARDCAHLKDLSSLEAYHAGTVSSNGPCRSKIWKGFSSDTGRNATKGELHKLIGPCDAWWMRSPSCL
jgi:hypothetical protein